MGKRIHASHREKEKSFLPHFHLAESKLQSGSALLEQLCSGVAPPLCFPEDVEDIQCVSCCTFLLPFLFVLQEKQTGLSIPNAGEVADSRTC